MNQTNQIDQTNQMNQRNQIDRTDQMNQIDRTDQMTRQTSLRPSAYLPEQLRNITESIGESWEPVRHCLRDEAKEV